MRQYITILEQSETPSKDLVSLENLKLELGIITDGEDDALEQRITRVSEAIAAYCDRDFSLQDINEVFVFDFGETFLARQPLVLHQYPVHEIYSINVDGALQVGGYELDNASGRLWKLSGAWSGRIEVEYRGGYDLPDHAPAALEWAVIEAIRQRRSFATRDPTVRQVSHGETSVGFYSEPIQGDAGFSRNIIDALKRYRRIHV